MNILTNHKTLPYSGFSYPVITPTRNDTFAHREPSNSLFGDRRFSRDFSRDNNYRPFSIHPDRNKGLYNADRKMEQLTLQFVGTQIDLYA